jgi:hypothetical protein
MRVFIRQLTSGPAGRSSSSRCCSASSTRSSPPLSHRWPSATGRRLARRARRRGRRQRADRPGLRVAGVLPPAAVGRRRRLRRRGELGLEPRAANPDCLASVDERVAAYRERTACADVAVPVDAVTASGSGLDPHISIANARLQAPAGRGERGLPWSGARPRRRAHRRAGRSGCWASRASTCCSSTSRSTSSSRPDRETPAMARGQLRIYLGASPGRGQDLRDAQRGPASRRSRHRRGRRRRRDPRPGEHRRADR